MATFFVIVRRKSRRLREEDFRRRVAAILEFYGVEAAGAQHRAWWFEGAGVGALVAWRDYSNQKFPFFAEEPGGRAHMMTHAPFGLAAVVAPAPGEGTAPALARKFEAAPEAMGRMHPPFGLVTVDPQTETVSFRNDALGLGKAFRLDLPEADVVASRPFAAHLMAAKAPEVNHLAWAMQQSYGWPLDGMTTLRGLTRAPGGSVFAFSRRGAEARREPLVERWFTRPPTASVWAGLERWKRELTEFYEFDEFGADLSGGRDSRGSAAIALTVGAGRAVLRTNAPPELDLIVARSLVGKLSVLGSFREDGRGAAYLSGRGLWITSRPSAPPETPLLPRALAWARALEGLATPDILARPALGVSVFAAASSAPLVVSGAGGESAKAYYWSPRMTSGARPWSLVAFTEDIKSTKARDRVKAHPLTTPGAIHFVDPVIVARFGKRVERRRQEMHEAGIRHYRFFDYWWLTERFGGFNNVGMQPGVALLPYMTPEYAATALQDTPQRKARAMLLKEIVARYQPAWKDEPYVDELQGKADKSLMRSFDRGLNLWEGAQRAEFEAILRESPAFEPPLRREAMIAHFLGETVPNEAVSNLKALGLVHKHALMEVCAEVGALAEGLKRPRRWGFF